MIRHLLVPIDGSDPAAKAIENAIALAGQTQSRLTFCYAFDRASAMTDAVLAQSLQVEAFLEEGVRTGRELLEAAAKAAAERGIAAETRLEDGAPVEAILHLARELAPDLIVMGTHGRRGLTRLVLGSTTESVLHRSAVPVLVVPTVHEAPPAAKGELRAQTVRA